MQALSRLLRGGDSAGLAALRVALPAPQLPEDPQVRPRSGSFPPSLAVWCLMVCSDGVLNWGTAA